MINELGRLVHGGLLLCEGGAVTGGKGNIRHRSIPGQYTGYAGDYPSNRGETLPE